MGENTLINDLMIHNVKIENTSHTKMLRMMLGQSLENISNISKEKYRLSFAYYKKLKYRKGTSLLTIYHGFINPCFIMFPSNLNCDENTKA